MNDVSCLMASNRPEMERAARTRWAKDAGDSELLIDSGPGLHGWKMDALFRSTLRDYCVVYDDDDYYAPDRIQRLVEPMRDNPNLLCVGTSLLYYVDERVGKAWLYDNATLPKSMFWMGAPAFRRSAYLDYGPWEDIKCGADLKFLRKIPRNQVLDLRNSSLMVCTIHDRNAASKSPHPPTWAEVPMNQLPAFYRSCSGIV